MNYSGVVSSRVSRCAHINSLRLLRPQVGDLTQFHPEEDSTHLGLRGASFIPDEQQVALTVDHDLLLEATACRGNKTAAIRDTTAASGAAIEGDGSCSTGEVSTNQ